MGKIAINFTALEYQSGIVRTRYVGVADMVQEGMSRAAAYRLLSDCPSKIRIKVQGMRAYMAIPTATYAYLRDNRQGRGNPKMQDSDFQRAMARRRWFGAEDSP